MSNLESLTSAQLLKAADLKEQIETLTKALNALMGGSASVTTAMPAKKKGGMSAAGRARIAAAQKARWAKVNAGKAKTAPKAAPVMKKRKMSAAGRAAIRAAVKARWAKIKAEKAAKK